MGHTLQCPLVRNSNNVLGMQSSGRHIVVSKTRDTVVGLRQTSKELSVTASGRNGMSSEKGDFKCQRKISLI